MKGFPKHSGIGGVQAEDDLKKELETKEYEYGFYTDIEADKFPVGLNEEVVIAISKKCECSKEDTINIIYLPFLYPLFIKCGIA